MQSRRAHGYGWQQLPVLLLALLLAACDGSDGGNTGAGGGVTQPSTLLATSSRALRFDLVRSAGDVSQDVVLNYRGTDVLAGFPPDVPAPRWLTITPGPVTANTARFTLTVNAHTLAPGRYETVVRFRTGNIPAGGTEADITEVNKVDVPVRLTLIDLNTTPQLIGTDFIKGSGNITGNITVQSMDDALWSATSDQPWLVLDTTGGTGNGSIGYTIDPVQAGSGLRIANVEVRHPRVSHVLVTTFQINVLSPDLLLNPESLTFAIDAGTPPAQYSQSVTVTDRLGGSNAQLAANWSLAAISVPWLAMTPVSGSSAPAVTATVSVRADQVGGLGNGTHHGTITLAYTTEDGVARTRLLPVTLNLAM